jgi:hypothetical protein
MWIGKKFLLFFENSLFLLFFKLCLYQQKIIINGETQKMEKMKNVFIVMSHSLNQWQKTDLERMGLNPIILSDVNPTLAKEVSKINPDATTNEIDDLGTRVIYEAIHNGCENLMIMGEASLFFNVCYKAKSRGWDCYVATTQREVVEQINADGSSTKKSLFHHIQFRKLS